MNGTEERAEQVAAQPAAPETAAPPPQPAPAPQAEWRPPVTPVAHDPRRKSPVLACILSAMPGLGQVYVGYYKLGFIHMVVFGSTVAFLANEVIRPLIPLVGIFLPFFVLYNIIDAGRRASYYNQALAGIDGVELPQEMNLPAPGGSIAGGIVLIVAGLLLLSNTAFEFSLDWVENWWPAAPVLFGAWLLFRGIGERAKAE